MMKGRLLQIANVMLFLIAAFFLATLKSSLWFQIFGYFPGPALWITTLIYIALTRSTLETVVFSYLCGFVLSPQTVMPEGMLMAICLALALSVQVLKKRIYWTAATYLMLVCGLGSLGFNIFHFFASNLLSEQAILRPAVTDWLVEALLTPLAAPVLFPLYRWFDSITQREQLSEAAGQ